LNSLFISTVRSTEGHDHASHSEVQAQFQNIPGHISESSEKSKRLFLVNGPNPSTDFMTIRSELFE